MGPPGLARYGSAPGSLLAGIAESVISGGGGGGVGGGGEFWAAGSESMMSRFFSGDSSCLTAESSCRTTALPGKEAAAAGSGLQRSYGLGEFNVAADLKAAEGGSHLVRHSSSPAEFLSHLMVDHGLSATRGNVSYSQAGTDGVHALANRSLTSQWSFSRQDSLSQISETSIPDIGESITAGNSSDEAAGHVSQSYISSNFPVGSWDDTTSIVFSAPPSKRAKDNNEDIITGLSNIDSQLSLPKTSLDMGTIEKYLQTQQESVPCKVRAKRGCATHPRSIAERERRTRISKRLRKLQDLVPNMDKQTSTSDMLDLAVQYIKELQSQVEKLNQEQANCVCGSKQEKV